MYLHDKFLRNKMETRFLSLFNKLRRITLLYGSFFIKLKLFSQALFCHRYQSKATPNTSAVMNTGGPSSPQERGRDSCLRAVLCYKRLFAKAYVGCKRFFLKVRKNVMFLNKIDIPYCCLPASPAVLKRFRRVSTTLVFHTKIVVSLGRPWQKVTRSCDEINNI